MLFATRHSAVRSWNKPGEGRRIVAVGRCRRTVAMFVCRQPLLFSLCCCDVEFSYHSSAIRVKAPLATAYSFD